MALNKMAAFKDEMCACKDTDCVHGVTDEMTKWAQDQARDGAEPPELTQEQTQRATKLGADLGSCMQAAMSAPPPGP